MFGSALAAEGIFAFFLESGFLSVLVFGWDRVSKGMHFFATLMVSLGSIFSAIWIIIANSWQHTPVGFEVVDNQAVITDFWAVVFNPSSMNHFVHAVLGAFILGAFFVLSISAYYLLRGRHVEFARKSFTLALIFGSVVSLAMGLSGHFQACMVAKYQPAKLATLEGHFHTGKADLHLFGVPDPATREVHYSVGIPGGLSFLVHEDFNASIPGLDQFRPEDLPPVPHTIHLLSSDGRPGRRVHRPDAAGAVLPLARHAVRETLAFVAVRLRRPRAVPGQPGRLGGDRGRPAAVSRLLRARRADGATAPMVS